MRRQSLMEGWRGLERDEALGLASHGLLILLGVVLLGWARRWHPDAEPALRLAVLLGAAAFLLLLPLTLRRGLRAVFVPATLATVATMALAFSALRPHLDAAAFLFLAAVVRSARLYGLRSAAWTLTASILAYYAAVLLDPHPVPEPVDLVLVPVSFALVGLSVGWTTSRRLAAAGLLEAAQAQLEASASRLRANHQRLRELLERLVHAQEEERRKVSLDLHDGMLQYVIAADMHLKAHQARFKDPRLEVDETRGNGHALGPDDGVHDLERGLERLSRAIAEGRRLISDLRPSTLDDFGLVATLQRYLSDMAGETGWQVSFEEDLEGTSLPPYVETTIFRIAQEALTNARRHSGTLRVAVSLRRAGGAVRVRIRDWGGGFDPGTAPPRGRGLGLVAMRERAQLMGGSCVIDSGAGRGTVVEAELPLDGAASQVGGRHHVDG